MATKDSKDRYKKFVDAGKAVTKVTSERFEEVARDLFHLSEVQRAQAQELLEDILKRSKKSTEFIVDTVKGEVEKQLKGMRVASREDISAVGEHLNQMKSDIASLNTLRDELKHDIVKLSEAMAKLVPRKETPKAKSDTGDATPVPEEKVANPAPKATRRPPAPRRAPTKKPDNGPKDAPGDKS